MAVGEHAHTAVTAEEMSDTKEGGEGGALVVSKEWLPVASVPAGGLIAWIRGRLRPSFFALAAIQVLLAAVMNTTCT